MGIGEITTKKYKTQDKLTLNVSLINKDQKSG